MKTFPIYDPELILRKRDKILHSRQNKDVSKNHLNLSSRKDEQKIAIHFCILDT